MSFDAERAQAAVSALRSLLENSDAGATEALAIVMKETSAKASKAEIEALNAAVNEFEFEKALGKLNEIATTCGLKEVAREHTAG